MNALSGHQREVEHRLILVVEDHPLNQKVARLLLERMGYTVHLASNGIEALEVLEGQEYDAILMDCNMPEMDGFEATRNIRKRETNGYHVPIIAVTALAMAGDRERCLAAGMDDYLTKPIDRDLLQQKLVYWMNTRVAGAAPGKVVPIFNSAFAIAEQREEPINIKHFEESYGAEASDLLQLFESSSKKFITELSRAIADQNMQRIAVLAHEIKGSSWAVGADEMARLAVFLEQSAGQENIHLVQRTFDRLERHFADVEKFLDEALIKEKQRT